VTVKDGWAVQSFGYSRWLPLGRPVVVIRNLDRWGADEILIQIIDRSSANAGPDFDLLRRLGQLGIGTPLIYGGGIRSAADGVKLIQHGADRLIIDSLLRGQTSEIEILSNEVGAQALIAALPVSQTANGIFWYNYRTRELEPFSNSLIELFSKDVISEIVIIDHRNEGYRNAFDMGLLRELPFANVPIIAFGGLSEVDQMREVLGFTEIAAVAVGNFLSYREHAIQHYKIALNDMNLRPASFCSSFP
jgi:cyclase